MNRKKKRRKEIKKEKGLEEKERKRIIKKEVERKLKCKKRVILSFYIFLFELT